MNDVTEAGPTEPPASNATLLPLYRRDGRLVGHTGVDQPDAESQGHWSWRLSSDGYAVRSETWDGVKKTIYLHREVIGAPCGAIVDHVNGDRLDNRQVNLRIATMSQNLANGRDRPRRSRYRGVYWHGQAGKWVSQISRNGRTRHLGLFDEPDEAARAYDQAAQAQWGEFARTNGMA